MKENRTLNDFSDEELDYMEENDPDRYNQVCENTNEDMLNMMFPNGSDEDD